MSEFVTVSFDDPTKADTVLVQLQRLQKEYLIDLEDAVVAIRDPDGRIHLKQSVNLAAVGAAGSGLTGALWGSLIGLLFLNPLAGMVLGGAVGAGTGALAGSLSDYGINDGLIRDIAEKISPNSSALFLLIRKVQPEKVIAELQGVQGTIIRSSLSPSDEQRLAEALSKTLKPAE